MILREKVASLAYAVLGSPTSTRVLGRLSTIIERQSLGKLLQELQIDCVIDVGANEGQYARLLRRVGYAGTVLSFEPNPDVFQKLNSHLGNDASWQGYNCGLGNLEGDLDFNFFEHSQISSFLPPSDALHSKLIKTMKVPVRRLDSILPEILPKWQTRRIFLKCDTQGFDMEVVKGSSGVDQAIRGLQSEIAVQSIYRGMPKYLESLAYYESLGYILTDLWLNNRTVEGDVLEYDCLMRRP